MQDARSEGKIRSRWGALLVLGGLLLGMVSPASAQRFFPDDPMWCDPDRLDMPFPAPQPRGQRGNGPLAYLGHVLDMPDEGAGPAVNINTVGGVPNSSWYTNRHYRAPMSRTALQRGPNATPGPVMEVPWQVEQIREGNLARVLVRDSTGRRFRLLFDPAAHPEMATGAAMVSSRLLHALGYNVPHYWIRTIARDRLVPGEEAAVTDAGVDSLLDRSSQRPDSTYRVLVSRIPGVERRIGPFSFHGRRVDDGNDIFPHEDRRELRGLRVVAAWMHHSKIRRRHTLDVGVREGSSRDGEGRRFVRHYLTDLHLTLGSAGDAPKRRWSGHEHLFELDRVLERAATIGLSGGDWAKTTPYWPALGHFEVEDFLPTEWRPEWPNAAFQRATPADAFWAAKQIRHVSRSDITAAVEAADYSSLATKNVVVETLLQRRNAIGQAYLGWGGGLGRFRVEGEHLRFRDLQARYDYAPDSVARRVTWHVFNNQEAELGRQLTQATTRRDRIPIPPSRAAFLRVRIQAPERDGERAETRVFLRHTLSQPAPLPPMSMPYEVVGIEREGGVDN